MNNFNCVFITHFRVCDNFDAGSWCLPSSYQAFPMTSIPVGSVVEYSKARATQHRPPELRVGYGLSWVPWGCQLLMCTHWAAALTLWLSLQLPFLLTAALSCSIFPVDTDCSAFIPGLLRTNSIFKEQKVKSVSASLLYYSCQNLVEGSPLIPWLLFFVHPQPWNKYFPFSLEILRPNT
jgi:hypothetical protein